MKYVILMVMIATLYLGASIEAMQEMEEWPGYFKKLYYPEPGEEIQKEIVLRENQFWKKVAETENQERRDNYLQEALFLDSRSLWPYRRKAIVCALATGANPDVEGLYRFTALHVGVIKKDDFLIRFVFKCGANPNVKWVVIPLLFFAETPKIAALLIDHNADIFSCDSEGKTVLHKFARDGSQTDLISYYIQQGCDVNAQDNNGHTPIMSIVNFLSGFEKTNVRLFLKAGADLTIKNDEDQTVWDIAKRYPAKDALHVVYNEFQQEYKAYGLLVSGLRLFSD